MKVISEQFPENQYVKEISKKSQIIIHHTVSGPGINGDVAWWKSTPERIATHFIIDREGIIHQFFSTEYWAYHLGLKASVFKKFGLKYKNLESSSISIELDSWGPLTSEMCPVGNPKFGKVQNVFEYPAKTPFRKYCFYEKYSEKQLISLQELLLFLTEKYKIPGTFNENIFDQNKEALSGKSGIWAHVSYRSDKSDPHPQKELVDLLKNLANFK